MARLASRLSRPCSTTGAVPSKIDRVSDPGVSVAGFYYAISGRKIVKQQKLDLTVRVTDVYKKARGRWLILHEHVSVPDDSLIPISDEQAKLV